MWLIQPSLSSYSRHSAEMISNEYHAYHYLSSSNIRTQSQRVHAWLNLISTSFTLSSLCTWVAISYSDDCLIKEGYESVVI